MRKPSEVIALALESGRYRINTGSEGYMCYLLSDLELFTGEELEDTQAVIKAHIAPWIALEAFLIQEDKPYVQDVCNEFWNNFIITLQQRGE